MYMSEKFGAWQVGNDPHYGQIEFKLFIPDRTKDPAQYTATPPDGRNMPNYGDPQIQSIQVIGDFQSRLQQPNWDQAAAPLMNLQPHAKGWVWTYRTPIKVRAGFYQYKYLVTFKNGSRRIVGDPCTRYGGSEHQNSGVVIGGSPFDASMPLLAERKPLRDLIVYEIMIDDFTNE